MVLTASDISGLAATTPIHNSSAPALTPSTAGGSVYPMDMSYQTRNQLPLALKGTEDLDKRAYPEVTGEVIPKVEHASGSGASQTPRETDHGFSFCPPNVWTLNRFSEAHIIEVTRLFQEKVRPAMLSILQKQKSLIVYPKLARKDASKLAAFHGAVLQEINLGLEKCRDALDNSILLPPHIHRLFTLQRDLLLEKDQLMLYMTGMKEISSNFLILQIDFLDSLRLNVPVCF